MSAVPIPRGRDGNVRWVRNKVLATYLNTSLMTIWRWRRDPKVGFPPASVINKIEYTDLDLVDQWMRDRVVDRATREVA